MRKPAVVVIGDHTQGLGVVRSAAAAGADVWVVNDKVVSLARFSRYLSGYERLRRGTLVELDRADAADALLDALLGLPIARPALLFGVDEDITRFVDLRRGALQSGFFVPNAGLDRIYDKHAFNALLPDEARIDTRLCSDVDLDAMDSRRFILKGRRGNAFRRATGEKALPLAGLTEADRVKLFTLVDPSEVVLQEVVESDAPVVSLCSFAVDGRIRGFFQYEKLRQHPNRFGTGTYLRSVLIRSLELLAGQILDAFRYTGISEIEFVADRRTGEYKVVEMNPRTWKSVHFATQCGENLVARYVDFVAGEAADGASDYAPGRYWVDLATDLPQMVRERRIHGYPRGVFECTWSRSDPLPALALWTLFPLFGLESRLHGPQAGERAAHAPALPSREPVS